MTIENKFFPKRIVTDTFTMGPYVIVEFIENDTQHFTVSRIKKKKTMTLDEFCKVETKKIC